MLKKDRSQMELRRSYLRYLLAIYELTRSQLDIGIVDIAKAMDCSKASVTNMMSNLMDMNLLVRERYGKVYLTDTGFIIGKDLSRAAAELKTRLPALRLELTDEEASALAHELVLLLPEYSVKALAGKCRKNSRCTD